ncbi:sigma-70 family RNA polymerase sigma factor [Actinotalea sp. K2]|uniref:sigma-70 family RNA polymerase sigma factor n=1 Tax=Actinotalea sp. K2 TaxID=2939438 RepID=UPI0020177D31|nr:sigma-70 family RNA polymerase sigma factor [Actinotalea sp. K2]MCL3860685.1 sigma-70 family RNA polymerase sigma factor [Actinotalea sp. K2]
MSTPGMTTITLPERPDLSDAAVVEAAWREFAGGLRAFIGRRVSRPEDADDILQLVALRLTQSQMVAHRLTEDTAGDRERRTVLAWLYTVTRNAITDYYRSAVHRREIATDALPERAASAPTTDEDADAEQALAGLASCVRPLLRLLPADQAAAVELVDLDGRSQVEAARAAGISVSGMKSRVQRGRRGLREAVTSCCQVQLDVRGSVQDVHPHHGTDCSCSADA